MKKLITLMLFICIFSLSVCAETHSFKTGSWDKFKDTGYDLVSIQNGVLLKEEYQINEPTSTQNYPIPSDKAIKSVNIIKKSGPVKLNLNIPSVEYDDDYELMKYVDRDCFEDKRDAYISTVQNYDKESYLQVKYFPLEMNDCEKGEFTLYREIQIEIKYYEDNKIKEVSHTGFKGGEPATIHIEYEENEPGSFIIVKDVNNLDAEDIEEYIIGSSDDIEVTPASDEALYIIEFYEDDELVDIEVIFEDLTWGTFDFRALVHEDTTIFPLAIEIQNKLNKKIDVDLLIKSVNMDDLETVTTMEKSITANPGASIHYINFKVTEKEIVNDIYIEATYNGITEYVAHNSLWRNTKEEVKDGLPVPPGVELIENLKEAAENETAKLGIEKKQKPATARLQTIIAIIIALLLTAAVIFIYVKYMRHKPSED